MSECPEDFWIFEIDALPDLISYREAAANTLDLSFDNFYKGYKPSESVDDWWDKFHCKPRVSGSKRFFSGAILSSLQKIQLFWNITELKAINERLLVL